MKNNEHEKSLSPRSVFQLCLRHFTLAILTTIVLSGCGSGGGGGGNSSGGGNTSAAILTGTAAAGAPITYSTVTLKDSAGSTLTTVTDINGTYSFDVSQRTPPFILQVRPNVEGSVPLHSFAFTHGVANITPFTNLALFEALDRTDPAAVNDAFGKSSIVAALSSNTYPTLSEAAFSKGQTIVLQNFNCLFRNEGLDPNRMELVTTPMVANGIGLDAMLEKVQPSISGGQVNATLSNGQCHPYSLSASSVTIGVDGMSPTFLGEFVPVAHILGVGFLTTDVFDQYVERALAAACIPGLPTESYKETCNTSQGNSPYQLIWSRNPTLQDTRTAVDRLKFILKLAAKNGKTPINIVAHSWGGIIAYIALRELEDSAEAVKVSNLITMGSPVGCLEGGGALLKCSAIKSRMPAYGEQEFSSVNTFRYPRNLVSWVNFWSVDDLISNRINTRVQNYYVDCDGTFRGDINPLLTPNFVCATNLIKNNPLSSHFVPYLGGISTPDPQAPALIKIRSIIADTPADLPSMPATTTPVDNLASIITPLPFSADAGQPYCDTREPAGPAVRLRWTKSVYADNYRVIRDDRFVGPTLSASQLSFVNELGLSPGGTYHYKVTAFNAVGSAMTGPIVINIPQGICVGTNPTTGSGNAPPLVSSITVGSTSISFGEVKVGSCATVLVAVRHMLGTAPVSGSISVDPPFSITASHSFSVSNGSATNIEIGYCPTSEGLVSQVATISSNATSINTSTISLSGTGSSITVGSPTQPLVATTSLPDGKVGIAYGVTLNAVGGTPPYTWSLAPGSQLPQGLTLSSAGTISGIPTSAGVVSIGVQIQDSGSLVRSAQQNLSTFIEGTIPDPFSLNTSPECSNNNPQIRLNWGSAAGVDYYQIYRDGLILDGVSANVNTYLDSHVVLGSSYSYTVKAINSGGQTSSNPSGVSASCVTPPGAFTLTATPWCTGGAPVTLLEWTGSAGRTLPDDIYRDGSLITSSNFNRYTDSAVIAGSTYNYFVRAKNSVGSVDSNQFTVLSRNDCAAPVAPEITMISPQVVTVGGGAFTLMVTGKNFDSSSRILWAVSGDTPGAPVTTPTLVNSATMTVAYTQGSSGFSSLLTNPGVYSLQVIRPGDTSFFDGLRSNITNFTVYNPILVVNSLTGNCRASLNCTPSSGFDVRINGNGFVNNIFQGTTYTSSTYAEINGKPTPLSPIGQGPVFTQMQLLVNGTLIPTPGTYSVKVCNVGTNQGTSCATTSLAVEP